MEQLNKKKKAEKELAKKEEMEVRALMQADHKKKCARAKGYISPSRLRFMYNVLDKAVRDRERFELKELKDKHRRIYGLKRKGIPPKPTIDDVREPGLIRTIDLGDLEAEYCYKEGSTYSYRLIKKDSH